jgi:hypothetical protein
MHVVRAKDMLPLLAAACLVVRAFPVRAWDAVSFDIPSGSKEAVWRDALAKHVGGVTEQSIKTGRVDVLSAGEVYEVDWIRNWKEGMGQVLAYSGETGKAPVLALISYSQGPENLQIKSRLRLDQADKECARHGIRLLVLFPTLPEAPHSRTNRQGAPIAE